MCAIGPKRDCVCGANANTEDVCGGSGNIPNSPTTVAPKKNMTIRSESHALRAARCDGDDVRGGCRNIDLTISIIAPGDNRAVRAQAKDVIVTTRQPHKVG